MNVSSSCGLSRNRASFAMRPIYDLLDSDGPDGIRQRDDLTVRTTRMVWVAGRQRA